MGGCVLSTEPDGAYITYNLNGETVKKKLGSIPSIAFRLAEYNGPSYMDIPASDLDTLVVTSAKSSAGSGYVYGYNDGVSTNLLTIGTSAITKTIDISSYDKIQIRGSNSGGANTTGTITLS